MDLSDHLAPAKAQGLPTPSSLEGSFTGRSLGLSFFEDEVFTRFHNRIYEDATHAVYLNEGRDFAVIHPRPRVDYRSYVPRSKKLGVKDPKVQERYLNRRFECLQTLVSTHCQRPPATVLEVGASDGTFLGKLVEGMPGAACSGVEPSAPHRSEALARSLNMTAGVEDLGSRKFDLICLFHVFEHFEDPFAELEKLAGLLTGDGVLVIEIPALSDPLLSLYAIEEFKDFYFQAQHPFIYSATSIRRLLESAGQRILGSQGMQRYGLANHLNWLATRRPGAGEVFADLAKALDPQYREYLESNGTTDTLFVCFAPAASR